MMPMISRFVRLPLLCWLVCALLVPCVAWTAEIRINGSLSTNNASVGEPVEYALTINGALRSDRVNFPEIDGIEVRQTGNRTAYQFGFGSGGSASQATITYTLIPKRAGTFTIPPVEVLQDGQRLQTKSFTLTVAPGKPAVQAGDRAFAEIRLKRSAFLGEALALEIRVYLDTDYRWRLTQQPILDGNGFTTQPLTKGSERSMELANKEYSMIPLRTVITPVKAGKLTIGPLPLKLLVSRPAAAQRSPFGLLQMGPAQEFEVIAPAVELDVKPLPTAGRPATFSGAIGKFEFEGVGTPNRVNVGEPVQMKLTISGEGNFDRISTPELADPKGWRVYDAEHQFEKSDDLGLGGVKTFSLPVAPTTHKKEMPQFAFAFFNPDTEKYETVLTAAAPLTVTGAAPPAESSATAAPPDAAPAAPVPTAQPQDILGILPQPGAALISGPHLSPVMLAALVVAPLPILVGLMILRARRGDPRARQLRDLRHEKSELLQRVRHATDRGEMYDAAARLLQLETALVTNKSAHACELPDILAARRLTSETVQAVETLFTQRADLVYAGGSRNADPVRETERDRVLEILSTYERSSTK
jgi:hypothetical protein